MELVAQWIQWDGTVTAGTVLLGLSLYVTGVMAMHKFFSRIEVLTMRVDVLKGNVGELVDALKDFPLAVMNTRIDEVERRILAIEKRCAAVLENSEGRPRRRSTDIE